MNKLTRKLKKKAIDALILSIEHFNRPNDRGRTEAVLILLDHAFEMLLKAALSHKGQKLRKPRKKQTLSFGECVAKSLTDGTIKFITEEQALLLQVINGQRDAAQHFISELSEHHLYYYAQAGVTLFRDIHDAVFPQKLVLDLPERVLPISTTAPTSLTVLFELETQQIVKLLAPKRRKREDAIAKARSLAILEGAINGEYEQPSDGELARICTRLGKGEKWDKVFPGVSSIEISAEREGHLFNLRLTKKSGMPVTLVKEGEGGGAVLAVRRVNETDYYSLGFRQLERKSKITSGNLHALIWKLGIQKDEKYHKVIKMGKSVFKRYSEPALAVIKDAASDLDLAKVRQEYQNRKKD